MTTISRRNFGKLAFGSALMMSGFGFTNVFAQTGKTAICIDAILAQKNSDVHCFYVAIGQKRSTVALVADTLRKHGAMELSLIHI